MISSKTLLLCAIGAMLAVSPPTFAETKLKKLPVALSLKGARPLASRQPDGINQPLTGFTVKGRVRLDNAPAAAPLSLVYGRTFSLEVMRGDRTRSRLSANINGVDYLPARIDTWGFPGEFRGLSDLVAPSYPCVHYDQNGNCDQFVGPHFVDGRNNLQGSFTNLQSSYLETAIPELAISQTVSKLDPNSSEDCVVLTRNDNVIYIIKRNAGSGITTTQLTLSAYAVTSSTVADVDADGDNDIIATIVNNSLSNELWILRNSGTGTFSTTPTARIALAGVSGYIEAIAAGDIDHDGDIDLVLSDPDPVGLSGHKMIVGLNSGSGQTFSILTLGLGGVHPSPADHSELKLGDLDQDGDLDIVVTFRDTLFDDFLLILRNSGNGINWEAFGQSLTDTLQTQEYMGLELADLDLDGDLDIITTDKTHQSILVFKNGGTIEQLTEDPAYNQSFLSNYDAVYGIKAFDPYAIRQAELMLFLENSNSPSYITHSNPDGSFSFSGVAAGTYRINGLLEGYDFARDLTGGIVTVSGNTTAVDLAALRREDSDELVLNGSFEVDRGVDYIYDWSSEDRTDDNKFPDGWEIHNGLFDVGNGAMDHQNVYQGSTSLYLPRCYWIDNSHCYPVTAYQDVQVQFGKKYLVSAWIKNSCNANDGSCASKLKSYCMIGHTSPGSPSCKLNHPGVVTVNDTGGFKRVSFSVEANDMHQTILRVECANVSSGTGAGGTVNCDGLSVKEIAVSPPPPGGKKHLVSGN